MAEIRERLRDVILTISDVAENAAGRQNLRFIIEISSSRPPPSTRKNRRRVYSISGRAKYENINTQLID